jgi:uncharacterized protein (DUF58 family)
MNWRAPQLEELAEGLAAALPPLLLDAVRVADNLQAGAHGRRRAGIGESFWQFRRYQTGDDVSAIDWRQSARHDKIYIREKEWEATQTLCLWCDLSPSMHYASDENLPAKSYRALLLATALGCLALRGGEQVTVLNGEKRHALRGKQVLPRLAQYLSRFSSFDQAPDLANLPRRSSVVLFSDFFQPLAAVTASLQQLASSGCRGALVQILDPAEISFPFSGHVLMQGVEGENELDLRRAETVAKVYKEKLHARQTAVQRLAQLAGWHYALHNTAAIPAQCLLELFAALMPPRGHR